MTSGKISECVAKIEAELAAAWAPPDPATGEPAKVRASMMSYVVVTSASDLDRWRAASDELAHTHPGRALLLTIDGRLPPWDLEADVTAVCRPGEGSAPICSDRVEIAFGAMAAGRAVSVVKTIALHELPLVLEIARGAPPTLAAALAREVDRVIVDSGVTSLARLAEIATSTRAPLADRAWVRTFTWRELVARFFDGELVAAVGAIRSVALSRTAGPADPVPLLLGWLASRLGWRLTEPARAEGPNGAVELTLAIDARADVGPSELTSIRLEATLDGHDLELTVARGASPATVCWSMRGARSIEREHRFGHRDETWVAVKAIDATEADDVYRKALRAAAAYAAMLGAQGSS